MSENQRNAVSPYVALLLGLSLAIALLCAEALAQASSSITVHGRTVTVTGGGNQQLSSGFFGGATITVDGTSIEVGRNAISLLDEDYEIGPDGPIHIRIQGDEIVLEVDGETVATVIDTSRRERELARIREAAEEGDVVFQRRLGIRYRHGDGVDQNHEEAIAWLRKSAEQGDALAQTNLAMMLAWGEGVAPDLEAARQLYEEAAAQGQEAAMANLGAMLLDGEGGPVEEERGLDLLRQAADAGDRIAAYNLFVLLRPGGRFGADQEAALGYLKRSAELGLLRALDRLGELYKQGDLVEADPGQAETYFRRAAEQDYSPAIYGLADLLINHGETTHERLEEGLALLKAAVDGDDVRAINDWAVYNFEGIHVDQNEAEGVALFRRAALAGNVLAKRNLGVAYEFGRGVERNLDEARSWYRLALEGGHDKAQADLDRLAAETPSYWYAKGDQAIGPIGLQDLQALIDEGGVGAHGLIWTSGLPDWIPASAYEGLARP